MKQNKNTNQRGTAASEAPRELPAYQAVSEAWQGAEARQFARRNAAVEALLQAAKLAVIEFGYVKGAEQESNALPDLRAALAQYEEVA
jgi:hypothetical protein